MVNKVFKTHLLGGQSLAGKVVAACCEALFDDIRIHFKEVLHLAMCALAFVDCIIGLTGAPASSQ